MLALFNRGESIDVVSIKNELKKENFDYKVALAELSVCYENQVIEGNLLNFVKDIKNKSLLRQIIGTMASTQQKAELDEADPTKILSKIEGDVIALSEQVKDDRPVDAKGIVKEIEADILKKQKGWKSFNTGFEKLDEQSGGLIPTHCWILGAYTGSGKTFLLLQILLNVLEQGAKVMLFSTEMDRKMNMLRLLGNLAGMGTIQILKGDFMGDQKEDLEKAQKKMSGYKDQLTIYDNVYTVEEMRLKIKKQKLKTGLDIVFLDFIQNLRGESNIYDRMSNAAISLQQIAQELNVTMFLASQVSQASANWASKGAIFSVEI